MNALINHAVTLASRPVGEPEQANFAMTELPVPEPGEGQMLCRTIYLSLDPYMRGRMSDAKSYADPVGIGEVMVGGTVSQVVSSNLERFSPGDFVLNMGGWQEYSLSDGSDAHKLDPAVAPISTAVGVLGMPGMTAYVGLLDIGEPKSGETVVVSAASGAVGTVVGQIAKIKGCRVVGVAGAREKCDFVTDELGFDACVSYKSEDFAEQLAAACPDGVDVYFENVGGSTSEAVMALLNNGARVPLCGLIAHYNATELPPGPNKVPALMVGLLTRRVRIQGFIVFDHGHRLPDFVRDVGGWIREGAIKYREDIVEGLDHAPEAFMGLLKGRNFGKLLIRVSEDPTR